MKKIWSKLSHDSFLQVSLTWALGITGMIMVLSWAQLQLNDTNFDKTIFDLVPYLFVLFGAAYMVKFVGRKPVFYTTLCGIFVAFGMAGLGLFRELVEGLSFEAFARFIWVASFRSIGMAMMGALGGWIMTRGRVPIEIELPDKKEIDAARQQGQPEPAPRILTPVSSMPGQAAANLALLDKMKNDPDSILSESEKRRRAKAASRTAKKK
ncbi:MAG: hypothetical protein HXX20_15030 [Chloroflexi bacterium]|nr:hypothetical protein [Chloroflexota bacterium]